MWEITQHRGIETLCSVLCVIVGLLMFSAAAKADPGTVTGFGGLSMTVSDTTPEPGQTVTISLSDTVHQDASSATMGFGDTTGSSGTQAQNLASLALVSGSCASQFSNCTFVPTAHPRAFRADVPTGTVGDPIAGSAQFTVSAGAPDGQVISFFGYHSEVLPFGGTATQGTGPTPLALTVTAPPAAADLAVSLSATAGGLASRQVSYDVAVHDNGPATATSATITTQLSPAVSVVGSATCTVNFATDRVSCPIGSVASGATTHATFTATYSLLTLGTLPATATRTASAPTDSNVANDSDSADCTAVTALLITC
jgi:Domain of unknown function DUF11